MPTNKLATTQSTTIKGLLSSDTVKKKFQELLGKKAQGFITSILQVVSSNDLLSKADPMSVYAAASIAATLDLPINQNLGFAYIIPYNDRKTGKQVAQFQMGYKAFVQLAQRSGLFKTIAAAPVYEGQLVAQNPLKGYSFDFTKRTSDKIIGYAAYFELLNGFEKTLYMTMEELQAHGKRYSQSYKKGFGLWADNFDAMATKTVIKLLLSKYAPLSVEMQTAVATDQAVINADTMQPEIIEAEYIDNEKTIDVETSDLTSGLKITGEKPLDTEQEPLL